MGVWSKFDLNSVSRAQPVKRISTASKPQESMRTERASEFAPLAQARHVRVVIASRPPQAPAAFEVTVSRFILRAAGLKERRKPPGEASFARFQICLTTPSLKNPPQIVSGIFARSLELQRCSSAGGGSSLW